MRMICSSRFWSSVSGRAEQTSTAPHLEALVLEHAFNGRVLAIGGELGLEDDTERAVADDLALRVLHLAGLAGEAILDLFANDLFLHQRRDTGETRRHDSPPIRRPENVDGRFCCIVPKPKRRISGGGLADYRERGR